MKRKNKNKKRIGGYGQSLRNENGNNRGKRLCNYPYKDCQREGLTAEGGVGREDCWSDLQRKVSLVSRW